MWVTEPNTARPIPSNGPTFVIGIGASAGGLEALEQFFSSLPDDSGAAFVVVQHLSPDFESMMDELLSRHTSMPILRAAEGMALEPNTVYMIPPGKELSVHQCLFKVIDRPSGRLTFPIDVFFKSLAEDFGPRAVAIVLSGTGTDGSRGIQDIRNHGGLVLVQDEVSAKFSGMPVCAAASGQVHAVLTPEEMPDRILRHLQQPPIAFDATPHEAILEDLGILLLDHHGLDLSQYKPMTIIRRLEKRMPKVGAKSPEGYIDILKRDPEELERFHRDLLIGVTRFLRDPDAFEKLRANFPSIFSHAGPDGVRVWVPGCATGQEAYTLAALFRAYALEKSIHSDSIKIFGTDVNRESLAVASAGVYPEDLLDNEPEIIRQHFELIDGMYRVRPELRRMIVFAPHNVLKDPPFTRLDLISCRNVLIYFTPAAQHRVTTLFHFALRKKGVLFLGPSESLGDLESEFEPICYRSRLFRKRREVRLKDRLRLDKSEGPTASRQSPGEEPAVHASFHKLLQRYVPPTVMINERNELVHVFGDASRYLSMRPGRTTLDIEAIVHPNLRTPMIAAIQRIKRTGLSLSCPAVPVEFDNDSERVTLNVEVVRDGRLKADMYLVSFEKVSRNEAKVTTTDVLDGNQASEFRVSDLQEELRATEERLETTIEELETSNEELQATNEELLSSNEEMQSTNEELQSVNEELYTVNAEHQRKIAELVELNHDLDNLLKGIAIETLFLDRDLRIRRYTPSITESFSLLPADVGRPLRHLASNLVTDTVIEDAREVLKTEEPLEREVLNKRGTWLSMRMRPYRTSIDGTDGVDGVILTFSDISHFKSVEARLEADTRTLDFFLNRTSKMVFVYDAEGRCQHANGLARAALEGDTPMTDPWPPKHSALQRELSARLSNAERIEIALPVAQGAVERTLACEIEAIGGDLIVCMASPPDER